MTALTIANTLKYASLQMAAEALYGFDATKNPNLSPGQVTPENYAITTEMLTIGNQHASRFTQTDAEKFSQDWVVVEHKSNTTTGFSGTLFKNRKTDELVLSIRSTEFIDDSARDNKATNELEIAEHGWAFGQIDDLEQWYKSRPEQNTIRTIK